MNASPTLADWDWLINYNGREPLRLHAPTVEASPHFDWDDWDGSGWTGRALCGKRAKYWQIPGVFSRMECERCAECCRQMGYPTGVGSPKNDPECRTIMGANT